MDRQADYIQVIQEAYPDISIISSHFHPNQGQYSDVLVINGEIIFRFPRFPEGVESILREVQILSRIRGRLPLPVPDPIYTSQGIRTVGKVFMGYRMLQGEPLWRETFHSLGDEIQRRLVTQLAGFLRELHRITADQISSNLPIQDGPEEWSALYLEIQQHLFPLMRPDACEWIRDHFETYLDTPRLHTYAPVLRHGDFGTCNILYDPGSQGISGVIDFGFAGIGDPALDIAALSNYGEALLAWLSLDYPGIDSMLERARFYRGTYALQEALHGFKTGDKEAFESGMALYI
jgi:aminoglycoside 2''-phosphotransferase